METRKIAECMENGIISYLSRDDQTGNIEWNEHPKCKGVFLKHLIKGADTTGKVSCHLVKVEPNCIVDEHIHEAQWELHEVIEGEGNCLLNTKEMPYNPGRMVVIPKGIKHKVIAGNDGLVLLAKYFPALL